MESVEQFRIQMVSLEVSNQEGDGMEIKWRANIWNGDKLDSKYMMPN